MFALGLCSNPPFHSAASRVFHADHLRTVPVIAQEHLRSSLVFQGHLCSLEPDSLLVGVEPGVYLEGFDHVSQFPGWSSLQAFYLCVEEAAW